MRLPRVSAQKGASVWAGERVFERPSAESIFSFFGGEKLNDSVRDRSLPLTACVELAVREADLSLELRSVFYD